MFTKQLAKFKNRIITLLMFLSLNTLAPILAEQNGTVIKHH